MTSSYLGAWSETHIFGFAAGLDNLSRMYDTVICAGFGSIDQCHSEVKSKRERDGNAMENVKGRGAETHSTFILQIIFPDWQDSDSKWFIFWVLTSSLRQSVVASSGQLIKRHQAYFCHIFIVLSQTESCII